MDIKMYKCNSVVWLLFLKGQLKQISFCIPGPGCSKLMTSLVNSSLKFQMLIPENCQYFL